VAYRDPVSIRQFLHQAGLLFLLLLHVPGGAGAEDPMYYFAYGSNMDPSRMEDRGIAFHGREPARLPGYRLEFNKLSSRGPDQGFANIVPDCGAAVEGVLYTLSREDLALLDLYEGFPAHYGRMEVEVRPAGGRVIAALAYIARPEQVREGLKPSREYLGHLLAAGDLLSAEYLGRLRSTETADPRR
jgi:cation transport regulator ChaC